MSRKITVSSGNLYADLGFANPELEQAKAELARQIRSSLRARGLTQTQAGELLGVSQADISRITRGRLGGDSMDRLMVLLARLGVDVTISTRSSSGEHERDSIAAIGVINVVAEAPAPLESAAVERLAPAGSERPAIGSGPPPRPGLKSGLNDGSPFGTEYERRRPEDVRGSAVTSVGGESRAAPAYCRSGNTKSA